jgi:ABC-type sugar transport system ATPase subunit
VASEGDGGVLHARRELLQLRHLHRPGLEPARVRRQVPAPSVPRESFLALFANRFEQGIFILDEPEAALSPQRQLSFLKIIHDLETSGRAQFLVSTHSPILLSYPGAVLFSLDGDSIREVDYRETEHYRITRDFLNAPERYFAHLFADSEDDGRAEEPPVVSAAEEVANALGRRKQS